MDLCMVPFLNRCEALSLTLSDEAKFRILKIKSLKEYTDEYEAVRVESVEIFDCYDRPEFEGSTLEFPIGQRPVGKPKHDLIH